MNHLGLFAKYWQPGQVKTRLATTFGPELACRLYKIFLFNLLDRLDNSADSRCVVFSPFNKEANFRTEIDAAWDLEAQSGGDLGQRMLSFFEGRFREMSTDPNEAGENKVVVIGADCPQLSDRQIAEAFELLDSKDVVVGPSEDGGYYLLGMKSEVVDVFAGVQWSTPQVLSHTIEALEQQGKGYALMDVQTDVDDACGLTTLVELLGRGCDEDPAQRLLDQIKNVLPENWSL